MLPDNAYDWNVQGVEHCDKGEYQEAEASLIEAIRLDSTQADYWRNLAEVEYIQKKYSDAEISFKEVIKLDGCVSEDWYKLGFVQDLLTKYSDSEISFKKAIALDATNTKYWLHLANSQNLQNKWQDGEIAARVAIKLNPNNPYAWNKLGAAQTKQGRYEEAADSFQESVKLDPNSSDEWINLSWVQCCLRKYSDSEASCKMAIQLDSMNSLYWNNLSGAQFNQGKLSDAEESLKKAISLQPTKDIYWKSLYNACDIDHDDMIAFINTLYEDRGNFTKAVANLKQRTTDYQHSEQGFSYLKAKASYFIVSTYHKNSINESELDLYKKKLDAPSMNVGSPRSGHNAFKYYYSESLRAGQALSGIYTERDLLTMKSACFFSKHSLKLTCYQFMIDNHMDINSLELGECSQEMGEWMRETAADEIMELKFKI